MDFQTECLSKLTGSQVAFTCTFGWTEFMPVVPIYGEHWRRGWFATFSNFRIDRRTCLESGAD